MSTYQPQVLIIDDDERARRALSNLFAGMKLRVVLAPSAEEADAEFESAVFDVVAVNGAMRAAQQGPLVGHLAERFPELPIIACVAEEERQAAARALEAGAADLLTLPLHEAIARAVVRRALEIGAQRSETARFRREVELRHGFTGIVAESEAMQSIVTFAKEVAPSNVTILVIGEAGTGREHLASAIHLSSPRGRGPFVAVNVSTIPEMLLESDLFGHEKGAFAGAAERRLGRIEEADGGTIFLDEIGGMPPSVQAKLLRFLMDGRFERLGSDRTLTADVRVIAATHQNLRMRVREGRFSEDLFARLNVFPIEIPPLRERRADIAALCDRFLVRVCDDMGKRIPRVHERTRRLLDAHSWPGNVRELRNTVEHAVIALSGEVLTPDLLPGTVRGAAPPEPGGEDEGVRLLALPPGGLRFEALERDLLIQAMERARGNKSKAATHLGLSRATLRYRLEKHGLE